MTENQPFQSVKTVMIGFSSGWGRVRQRLSLLWELTEVYRKQHGANQNL